MWRASVFDGSRAILSLVWWAGALAGACAGPPVLAQPLAQGLDPEPKTPYVWRVVLHAPPHPAVGPEIRRQIERDVQAALQPVLGSLGIVECIDLARWPRDRWESLWQQFEDKGFAAIVPGGELSGVKTHFVRLDYANGLYRLRAQQYDGFTGLTSPLRQWQTRSPEELGRGLSLILERDFGPVGTVQTSPLGPENVRIVLRGNQLGSYQRWVREGDIFVVAQVFRTDRPAPPLRTATGRIIQPAAPAAASLSATPRAYTVLRVIQVRDDGQLDAVVLSAYQTALPAGRAAGYRCMKLGTTTAPLRIRLAGSDGTAPRLAGQVLVRALENGFQGNYTPQDTFDFRDGLFHSPRPYAHLACVTISLGPGAGTQFPVPIVDEQTVTLPFETDPKRIEAATLLRTAASLATRVTDARHAQSICFEAVSKLIQREKNVEALARAKAGYQAAAATAQSIDEELARLREATDKLPELRRFVPAVEAQLAALRKANADLAGHIKTLEQVVALENDPKMLARDVQIKSLVARLELLLARGEVEEALNVFDQLLTLKPDHAEFRARRDKLQQEWKPKNETHAKARDYLLRTWPGIAAVTDHKAALPPLGSAIDTCIQHGDHYTLRRLQQHFQAALARLQQQLETLDVNSDSDRKTAEDIQSIVDALRNLEKRILEFIQKQG